MNELTLDGKTYVSSRRAADITGYAKDYVGQLCREGHVEARLVGRNWYVLESSIREHRFGKSSESRGTNKEPIPAWNQPKYIAEEPTQLPTFAPTEVIADEPVTPTTAEGPKQPATILSDMEYAWRDWFTQREEMNTSGAVPDEVAVVEEPVYIEETPIVEDPERLVQIARVKDEPILDLTHRVEPLEDEEPEAVIVEERVTKRRSRRPVVGNLTIQSAFIGVALVAVTLAVVGTGFGQKILGSSLYRLPEINFIAGVAEINK